MSKQQGREQKLGNWNKKYPIKDKDHLFIGGP